MIQAFFQRLNARIEELKESEANQFSEKRRYLNHLKPYITPKDLRKIIEYIFQFVGPEFLSDLNVGIALRIPKKFSKQTRTFSILHDFEGGYVLLLETKSKFIDHHNQTRKDANPIIFSGSSKRGKRSFRIDLDENNSETGHWVSLVSCSSNIDDAHREAQMSLDLPKECARYIETLPYVPENSACKCKTNICQHKKITLYQPFADLGSLQENGDQELIDSHKEEYILQLLQQIKRMHDKGYVHQDIKPGNVLLDAKEGAKLSDYGLSRRQGEAAFPLATLCFESPEISAYHRVMKTEHADYYSRTHYCSYGRWQADRTYASFLRGDLSGLSLPDDFSIPHTANDMFAFGAVVERLYSGSNKYAIAPLLSGLLAVDRAQRLTVDQAIEVFEKIMAERAAENNNKNAENTDGDKDENEDESHSNDMNKSPRKRRRLRR